MLSSIRFWSGAPSNSRLRNSVLRGADEVVLRALAGFAVLVACEHELSALEVSLGERISAGTRLGQVDVLDGYKIRAAIDEYYIARISRGRTIRPTMKAAAKPAAISQPGWRLAKVQPLESGDPPTRDS